MNKTELKIMVFGDSVLRQKAKEEIYPMGEIPTLKIINFNPHIYLIRFYTSLKKFTWKILSITKTTYGRKIDYNIKYRNQIILNLTTLSFILKH